MASFFKGSQHNRHKRVGDINIVQLTSNITDYVIIIELYNFKEKDQALKSIGQKLKAIFSLQVSCFTGCKQKADCTLLCKQYQVFDLLSSTQMKKLMDEVSTMAIN